MFESKEDRNRPFDGIPIPPSEHGLEIILIMQRPRFCCSAFVLRWSRQHRRGRVTDGLSAWYRDDVATGAIPVELDEMESTLKVFGYNDSPSRHPAIARRRARTGRVQINISLHVDSKEGSDRRGTGST
jgi:hypothetical protein